MKKWIITIIAVLPLLLAANLTINVNIPQWDNAQRGTDSRFPLIMDAGNPTLPFYPVKALIPMGGRVTSVEVIWGSGRDLRQNIELDFVREPQPISKAKPDQTVKNRAVWSKDAFYPGNDFSYHKEQYWKGYALALINLYPWQYNPVSKTLAYHNSATLVIRTEADNTQKEQQSRMLTQTDSIHDLLNKTVVNPEAINSYSKFTNHVSQFRDLNPNDPKQMLIITSQNKMAWFSDYAAWKTAQNIPTGIFAIESILNQYPGVDNPAKLRDFIFDAYLTWSDTTHPLEYVILAGDDEIIPIRGLFGQVYDTIDNWMPSDLYYGCLDGNWNANGNNLWGEYPADQPDLLPEVIIGRFPAETQAEFANIMNKTMFYVDNSTFSNNIAIMYGENLNWNPLTWGGDYKDDVAQHIPAGYHLETYYQRDGTYSPQVVRNTINSGAAIMNHMGHANEGYLMGQGNNNIQALENTEYGFLYSQGCYPAAFDQRTSGDGEAIGEHLVMAQGALYAFIGNTRYGWYMPGSINGPSQYYDREFFIGLFEQNLHQIGKAYEYSLIQNINNAVQYPVMLWCYYETIIFGDPSVAVKPPNPDLPLLTLEEYHLSDIEGDNDNNINPGEAVRIYPKVRNLPGWGTAYNVFITTQGLPDGVVLTNCHINIPQLAAGEYADSTLFIRFEVPNDLPFGNYNFKLRLVAYDPVTFLPVCERRFPASFSITLLDSHFPWDYVYGGKSSPVVGDLNFNNETEILYVDVFGDGHFINPLGIRTSGFDFGTEENLNRSFAVGIHELINTPIHTYAFTSRTGRIYAIAHRDSTTINYINYDTGSTLLYTPVLADINNNGLSEVIAAAHNRKIYALDYNNQLLSGFPVELTGSFSCELAVADLDGNGSMEIIAGTTDGKLWAIEHNGTIRAGFPVQLAGTVTGAPLVLDNNRIVAGTSNNLYIIEPNGTILTHRTINGDMASGAIPVDIERNGELDIVFVTIGGTLYVCRQDGSDIGAFPVQTGTFFNCPPLAIDLDGDNQYEIILQSHVNSIYIYNHDATTVSGFPFTLNFNGATPATVTDLDGDGYYDLVSGYSHGVLVIKLRRPVGNLDAWTVYRGNLKRQGSFAASGFVSNLEETSVDQLLMAANYPNPFNPVTTITFNLPKAEINAQLIVYNNRGQKVKTLINGSMDKGRHSIIWNGTDEYGKAVGSGIYFYRLNASGTSVSRKMLLLK